MINFHLNPKRIILLFFVLAGCTAAYKMADFAKPAAPISTPKQRILKPHAYEHYLQQGNISYYEDVKPILDSRCVVCHACYDAPCQLKLSSFSGLDRGATKITVYDTKRQSPQAPTRLFIDEKDTAGWRNNDFFPVLNEADDAVESRMNNSLLAKLLKLKRNNPLPEFGQLSDEFELDQDRDLECPRIDEFDEFQQQHPNWGMPYALPGISEQEENTLLEWLEAGAIVPEHPPLSQRAVDEINKWENFFNGRSFKQQLVSRYIYEHLFIGHIHFDSHPDNEFYYLVRSKTPSGQPIDEIQAIRPYDSPGSDTFYYRLRRIVSTIVDKNHFIYELSDEKLKRYHKLFTDADFAVTELPPYTPEYGANPFKAFIDLPLTSRYKFLLDDAEFFFAAFIKGPVCRGQVAVNVIRDQFWITFLTPENNLMQESADFLAEHNQLLKLPASGGDNLGPFDWTEYNALEQSFLDHKERFLNREISTRGGSNLDLIWDGNGHNRNAALTVFRHFNSATVTQGFLGATPLTGWVVDYPIFERIYYLLVAGFNVYGSSGHQIATRKYMDFLRVEAENNFLRFMPSTQRKAIHHSWYLGVHPKIFDLMEYSVDNIINQTNIFYQTTNHKKEFFQLIRQKLAKASGPEDAINNCSQAPCIRAGTTPQQQKIDLQLRKLAKLKGNQIKALPEVSFLRIKSNNESEGDHAYTLLRNKSLSSVAFMFAESLRRTPEKDTLTVVPGFLGSYPNIFFSIEKQQQLLTFINRLQQSQSEAEIARFYAKFGVRRTNPEIWQHADWFYKQYQKDHPRQAGIFDLNRYENL